MAVGDVGDEHADVDPLGRGGDRRQRHERVARPWRALDEPAEVVVGPHRVEPAGVGGLRGGEQLVELTRRTAASTRSVFIAVDRTSERDTDRGTPARTVGRQWASRSTRPSSGRSQPDERALEKIRGQGKLTARERIDLLLDAGSFVEDGVLANADGRRACPADGVVTGRGTIDGMPAVVVANDPMVKAGSWGARTVEKMVRASETALAEQVPIVWLVDSAGARLTDQVQLFPGRRGAGRIFYNQVRLSGQVPQICCLFGPSAAGGAYIPSFCDVVFMVDGNASMYLGSPRMAEMVVGEITTLEEMGGARMHVIAVRLRRQPRRTTTTTPSTRPGPTSRTSRARGGTTRRCTRASRRRSSSTDDVVPADERVPFDMHAVIDGIVDRDSFFEIKPLFARELIVGLGRLDGHPVGDRRQQLGAPRRHAVRRLGRQGGPVHLAAATPSTSR